MQEKNKNSELLGAKDIIFSPPYHLNGKVSVSFCLSTKIPINHLDESVKNLKFIKIGRYAPIMLICSHWERHPEYPKPYNEVIISAFIFKNFFLRSVPLVLYLDEDFHIELGRKYYALPKIKEHDLLVEYDNDKKFSVRSKNIFIDVSEAKNILKIFSTLLSCVLGAIVSIGTYLVPVQGCIRLPFIESRISLRPNILSGFTSNRAIIRISQFELKPILTAVWGKVKVSIGKPTEDKI